MRDRLLSNRTPRFLTVEEGVREVPLKVMDVEVILERCCSVPMRRNSVLEGLSISRFRDSQEWTESRMEDRRVRESVLLGGLKEI